MIYPILFYIFFITSSPISLFAKEKEVCRPIESFKNQVAICIDNPAFSKAAKVCYEKYEALSRKLAEEKEPPYSLHKKQQSEYFKATTSLLEINKNKLAFLINKNEKIQEELKIYLSNLIKPIDDRNLLKTNCYADSYIEIQSILSKLKDDYKKTLLALKKISSDKSQTLGSKNDLNSSNQTISEDKPKNRQMPSHKKPRQNPKESDISGTEEIKEP
ncbi:MAG: hypothetical protein M9962_01070 [Oligoflexia bacterium]|nr:hypothetical protein [Oligoflexia bacterium]